LRNPGDLKAILTVSFFFRALNGKEKLEMSERSGGIGPPKMRRPATRESGRAKSQSWNSNTNKNISIGDSDQENGEAETAIAAAMRAALAQKAVRRRRRSLRSPDRHACRPRHHVHDGASRA
jgi:hypothetical protein